MVQQAKSRGKQRIRQGYMVTGYNKDSSLKISSEFGWINERGRKSLKCNTFWGAERNCMGAVNTIRRVW